jgi:hypothetical protein
MDLQTKERELLNGVTKPVVNQVRAKIGSNPNVMTLGFEPA